MSIGDGGKFLMFKLKVFLRKKQLSEIHLNDNQDYIAGRREDAEIVLESFKGISRDHFRINSNGEFCAVEVLSKYGKVYFNGEESQSFVLNPQDSFTLDQYEFILVQEQSQKQLDVSPQNILSDTSVPATLDSEVGSEKTTVEFTPQVVYIKVMDSKLMIPKELLRLESGEVWTAGRDSSNQIVIEDQKVSRKQFEVSRKGQQYFINDLGSVNGTHVNGSALTPHQPLLLKSGDAISVLDNLFYFELHDPQFKNKLETLKQIQPYQAQEIQSQDYFTQEQRANELQVMQNNLPPQIQMSHQANGDLIITQQNNKNKRTQFIRIFIAIIALVGLYFYMEEENKPAQKVPANSALLDPFSKLSIEQQNFIRQTYDLAHNYYTQGKYQLAQQEILKIKDLVPSFRDSQDIERLATEALLIQDEQRKAALKEKEMQEIEDKIQSQSQICSEKITENTTMEELDSCLDSIKQFNPQHVKILELKAIVEKNIAIKIAEREALEAKNAEVQKLVKLYKIADKIDSNKDPFKSMDAHQLVIKAKHPDPMGLKEKSRAKISSIKKRLNQQIKSFEENASKYYESQDLKNAILQLKKAKMIDPTNSDVDDRINQWTMDLKKQMMSIYQEGILEESFGNVEGTDGKMGAKEKWKKIIELDIPDGDYYKKSKIKLKKYGVE